MLRAMCACTPALNRRPATTATAVLLTVLLLSGCAGLSQWRHAWMSAPAPAPGDRFALPPEGTDIVGQLQVATARYEDTLADIARRYDLGYDEIVAANPGVDPWLPGKGTPVVLPTEFVLPGGAREGLVLNLASMRLFYYPKPEVGKPAEVITHPMGIGREGWQTPLGTVYVTQKIVNPAWTVPASVRKEHAEQGDPLPPVVPPGPDNPLGDYAMRLSNPSYLIHGTNKPWGVGQRVSHGCIRLYPEDIARLFPAVPEGTPVRIINEPYLAGWRDGQLYLEAHPPLAEDSQRWNGSLKPMEQALAAQTVGRPVDVSREKAETIAREARGIPMPVTPGSPDLGALVAKAPRVTSTPPWAPVDYETTEPVEEQQRTVSARNTPQAN
jgi:L,D-transpeptidase ErfK/SrfK